MNLEFVFHPRSVAVVGASSSFGKWGQMIFSNIVAGHFPGKIFPVNPREEMIFGLPVFRRIQDIPEPVDLAIICTPAETVVGVLEGCGEKGVKAAVVITSGFGETGEAGKVMERGIVALCRSKGILLVGPNTMGILCPRSGLFATGTHTRPRKGKVAFVSQSGNLGNQLIHWAEQQGVGVSLFVGSGNEAMITCPDYLEYLEQDSDTRIIILYIENINRGKRFFEVAKRVNRVKPVILLKGGRTEAGSLASASHTGAMGGNLTIFRAACRQAGLLEVYVPSELLDLSAGFSSLPLPKGNRVGIVTLGGGWGVVTADECNERGLLVPRLPDRIIESIGRYLPPFWSKSNPVDLVGTQNPDAPLVAVEELLKWDGVDAVIGLGIVGRIELLRLLIQSTREVDRSKPSELLDQMENTLREYEERYATRIVEFMEVYEKPVLGVSLTMTEKGTVRPIPGKRYDAVFYQTPESAVNVLSRMCRYASFQNAVAP
ncbi:MAG: CoA-binding protein [Deltaproteobacteria bacterium]|nr:CoA-binding protein [Deltaproteobacteria bacterium]